MNEFDIKASDWDKNPMHWDRSVAISDDILKLIPLKPHFRGLEFGAGTGILSFLLKDHFSELILLDNSSEMIRMINDKITSSGVKNLKTKFFDLEHSDLPGEKFDFIFTQMALHHVSDISKIISKFYKILKPDGYLAIADLYQEDGSFHGEGFSGHNGFNIQDLTVILQDNGFIYVKSKTCFVIERKISESQTKKYEVFLITAKKQ